MENKRQTYGLFTTIAMIIGIVIGSGIFFKADDILLATGGSVKIGILVLCVGAFGIVFGSLSLGEFALRSTKSGGFIGYFEEFINKKMAGGYGVFQVLVYLPTLTVVVSWAGMIYLSMVFDVDLSLEGQIIGAYVIMALLILMNTVSRKAGGAFQNISMVIKLIPLFLIALFGIIRGGGSMAVPSGVPVIHAHNVGLSWVTALAPIAFSYDGWAIATNITPEVKNPTKTMPRALFIAPILILVSYLLYFVGFTKIVGAEYVMSMGDKSLDTVANMIFGPLGGKLILIFATIAILGVVNGIVLGGIRQPQALAEKNICFPSSVEKINPKYQISLQSSGWYFVICSIWMAIHYITQKYGILGHRDVSEITIAFSYAIYIIFYQKILKMYWGKEITNKLTGLISPIIAICGSIIILFGSLFSSPFIIMLFFCICSGIFFVGYQMAK